MPVERRLNVAITRAMEQVIVFCSFEPHELDLSRSSSVRLADLKDYLLAARNGVEAAGLRCPAARDLHLEQIERALRDTGLEVRTHVGLSDFTVDLAVRADEDLFWVAVMLDGPARPGQNAEALATAKDFRRRCSPGAWAGPGSNVSGCRPGFAIVMRWCDQSPTVLCAKWWART